MKSDVNVKINWNRLDPERRLGLHSKKFTGVNFGLAFVLDYFFLRCFMPLCFHSWGMVGIRSICFFMAAPTPVPP